MALTKGCAIWQVDPSGVSLWPDLRNGGRGVNLGSRELAVATVVTESYQGVTSFAATARFCRRMCEAPRLPEAPVYGGNNWYYTYGKSSANRHPARFGAHRFNRQLRRQ